MRRTVQYVAVTCPVESADSRLALREFNRARMRLASLWLGNAVDGRFSATFQSDIKSLIDPPLVFRSEDGESAHFRGSPHMGSPARLRVEALDLYDADSAV